MSLPFVSVVVPVRDDAERLRLCLQALEAQRFPPERYEVRVVDNGSQEDVSGAAAGFPRTVVLRESQPGSYAARNRGLAQARGEVVAFTDADCLPEPDWLACGVAALGREPRPGLVAGRIDVFFREPGRPRAAEVVDALIGFPQRLFVEQRRFGATANVFTRRDVLDAVGPFDARLKSAGDVEWGQRVHAAGYPVAYADDAVVRHPARDNLRALVRRVLRVTGGLRDLRRVQAASDTTGALLRGLYADLLLAALPLAILRGHGSPAALSPARRRALLLPGSTLPYLWRDAELARHAPGLRARAIAIVVLLRWLRAAERLRLRFGGTSRRG